MITIVGTSHVSEKSIKRIDKAFEDEPDAVALELDPIRLRSLLSDSKNKHKGSGFFIKLIGFFQRYIGKRTGLMPGDEMKHAYYRGIEKDLDIYLIDQDIRRTVDSLKNIPLKEKIKAMFSIGLGLLIPFGRNISDIPSQDEIGEMLDQLEKSYPNLYRVLVRERDIAMADNILKLKQDFPEKDILVVVGAAHLQGIKQIIDAVENDNADNDE